MKDRSERLECQRYAGSSYLYVALEVGRDMYRWGFHAR